MSLNEILENVTARTAKGFEAKVKAALEASDDVDRVIRMDYKNRMPDFLVLNHGGKAYFVECKNYPSVKSLSHGLGKWMRQQAHQYEAFQDLADTQCVYLVMHTKGGTRAVEIEPSEKVEWTLS